MSAVESLCCNPIPPGYTVYESEGMVLDYLKLVFGRFACGVQRNHRIQQSTPDLHSLLLLAGDIETNPGPTHPLCPACGRRYAKTRGALQCCSCKQWLCLTTPCSGHKPSTLPPQPWLCLGCTHANNNNVPSTQTQHSSAYLGPPGEGSPSSRPSNPSTSPSLPSNHPPCSPPPFKSCRDKLFTLYNPLLLRI